MDIEAFQKRLAEVEALPSVPTILMELMEVLRDESSGTDQIGSLISQDAGLAARLLKLANSAMFGVRTQVTTIQRAVALLGRNQVRQICLGDGVWLSLKPIAAKARFNLEGFELHSLVGAEVAQELARRSKAVDAEEVYAAALLHDIGKFLLLAVDPEGYAGAVQTARETRTSLEIIEEEMVGWNHTVVGGWFAENWGLPDIIQFVALWHHSPETVLQESYGPLVALVSIADNLLKTLKIGDSGNPAVYPIGGLLAPLHLSPDDLRDVADRLKG
jgi:putative nucleotidyltransferase with HDIG domain